MPWTTPETFTAGQTLTAASMNIVSENLRTIAPNGQGAWTDWTPTLSNTWANGNATVSGKYTKVGRLIVFTAEIIIGSTTTKGASNMRVSLPEAARVAWDGDMAAPNIGVTLLDAATAGYWGAAYMKSTSTIEIWALSANVTWVAAVGVAATTPFTWGTGDKVLISGYYEAAS